MFQRCIHKMHAILIANLIVAVISQWTEDTFTIGPCTIAFNRQCPDRDVRFFLYTRTTAKTPELIPVGNETLNLAGTAFNSSHESKIIIHGYNSDMFLNVLIEVKDQYLLNRDFNIFAVDWGNLSKGPCYPAAVWNARFAGACSAQFINRLREIGVANIHIIGFSLGAHVAGFVANHLKPYRVSRITGLDPAMPGFSLVGSESKLDETDAEFVDIIHTNAFLQGTIQQSGHVDFYVNGGIVQPGCWAENRFFACNHHRAPLYFAESINTQVGFWGWPCPSYTDYLLGRCPPREPQILMGEYVDPSARGIYLVITDSVSPFAVGKYSGPIIEVVLVRSENNRILDFERYKAALQNCSDFEL